MHQLMPFCVKEMDGWWWAELCRSEGLFALDAPEVLVDTEPRVVQRCIQGDEAAVASRPWRYAETRGLFCQSGAGNNWACGYNIHGPALQEKFLELLQREVEPCDRLGGFLESRPVDEISGAPSQSFSRRRVLASWALLALAAAFLAGALCFGALPGPSASRLLDLRRLQYVPTDRDAGDADLPVVNPYDTRQQRKNSTIPSPIQKKLRLDNKAAEISCAGTADVLTGRKGRSYKQCASRREGVWAGGGPTLAALVAAMRASPTVAGRVNVRLARTISLKVGDISSIIYSVLSRALPGALESAPVHQLGDDELGCALMDLGESTEAQETLFGLLRRQAHLSLVLSDLGRSAGTSKDLVLDPWLLEHCQKSPDPEACGETFAEAAAAQSGRMASVARAFNVKDILHA
ncbi:TUBD1 [Symbiodinium sp. KB8]|nr:TUBD1 [Symbiodinium sp. KB8]